MTLASSSPSASNAHKKSKGLRRGAVRPAKELCSDCGLCDTSYIHYVKDACAFINQPYAKDAVQLRIWDDLAKDPELDTPDLEHFLPTLEACQRSVRTDKLSLKG